MGFAFDDAGVGLDERWYEIAEPFTRRIRLPFPPESETSGIAEPGFHPCVWYRIELTSEDLTAAGHGDDTRLLLHFGAVDYLATVWLGGTHLGDHEGGQTPFTFDVTSALRGTGPHVLVVRAYEDPADLTQPRGKQDWRERPHDIWYERTTGIWRTVWLEAVPSVHLSRLAWRTDVAGGTVTAILELPTRPEVPVDIELTLERDGEYFAAAAARLHDREARITIDLPGDMWSLAHDGFLWSPDRPTLLDAHVVLHGPGGDDIVHSYVGLRDVGITGDRLSLSARPLYLRSVLEQGYWSASHLVPPSPEALRQEVELILALGFNSARVHQKVEDPRFFFWADKLGLTLWGETAAGYVFSSAAVARLTREWVDIVRTYESHPSIICWVPFNESWGIGAVASDPAQQAYSRGLADLTRALDPTRPVISNDGWEHTDSDLLTIHDYEWSREVLESRYATGISPLLRNAQAGPRALVVGDRQRSDVPVLLTEIGGIRYAPGDGEATWGYSTATSDEDYASRIADVLEPIQSARGVAGFCWTQLTDTLQEANGLCTADRRPKLPVEQIRRLVRGSQTRF